MSMRSCGLRSFTLRTVLFCALAAAGTTSAAEVSNPADPAGGIRTIGVRELWRVGGPEDEENLLGVINKVLVDEQGSAYLMDVQLNEVQVFSADGEYLRTLGQEGDGPGEVRRLSDAFFLPNGNLGLIQAFPGRIVMVDRQGVPAGDLKLGADNPGAGGMFALMRAAVHGDRMILGGRRISRREDSRVATDFIARFDLDAVRHETYFEATSERRMGTNVWREADNWSPAGGAWTVDHQGRVAVCAGRNGYRFGVYGPDGTLSHTFSREYDPLRRSGEEIERIRQRSGRFGRRNRPAPDLVVEPTAPDILRIRTATDGNIWILPSRGNTDQPEGIHSTWDVFAPDGRFLHRAAVACDGDGKRDALFFAGADRLFLVKEHADAMDAFRGQGGEDETDDGAAEPLEVICYRILP